MGRLAKSRGPGVGGLMGIFEFGGSRVPPSKLFGAGKSVHRPGH